MCVKSFQMLVHASITTIIVRYLLPRMRLDLRELKFGVVGIHLTDLLPCRRTKYLYDLHQLIHARITWEDGLSQQQLRQHAAGTPNIDFGRVIDCTEDEFGCPIVPTAYVRYVRLTLHQVLGTAKIAQLQNTAVWIEQEVLRFNISVAYAQRVYVRQRSEQLVHVQLQTKHNYHHGV